MTSRTIAGRYEIVSRLGAGGGGVVWRARDTSLDRVVAVKEVPLGHQLSEAERDTVQARALREARAEQRAAGRGRGAGHRLRHRGRHR